MNEHLEGLKGISVFSLLYLLPKAGGVLGERVEEMGKRIGAC